MKPALRIVVAAVCVAAAGCWPWHQSETPQQQFIEAISRGESAHASQIWLHMSPQDKIKFAQSQGMQPNTNADEVKKLVSRHYQDQVQGTQGAEDSSGETIESPGTSIGAAGLQNLPSLGSPPESSPPTN